MPQGIAAHHGAAVTGRAAPEGGTPMAKKSKKDKKKDKKSKKK